MIKVKILILFIILWSVKKLETSKSDKPHYPPLLGKVKECVKDFAHKLGEELHKLSTTMTRKAETQRNFNRLADKIHYKSEKEILTVITSNLETTMSLKMDAVRNISEYAEFLAYNRRTEFIDPDPKGDFQYYNADNITNTTYECSREQELERDIQKARCIWWCDQKEYVGNRTFLKYNRFTSDIIGPTCDCTLLIDRHRTIEDFNYLPLRPHPKYDTLVNFNLSVVKIATQVYAREQEVLQGVRWTEPLDMIFIANQERDPTLKYQYFASPHGYMRHYPAIKWYDERYAQTYDPRTRSWYTEAMTSPKDVVILLDSSGSVIKLKRKLATHIVNNILDTLNDNDFVTIYLFANDTRPLVECFSYPVQANEENLRLLRETLDNYEPNFQAEVEAGLKKAFEVLSDMKKNRAGSDCNQAIMLITEEVFFRKDQKELFENNWRNNVSVRVFTYQLGKSESDARLMEWMACANKGYFVNISLPQEVREKTLPYLNVMSRPVNFWNKKCPDRSEFIWSYLYIDLADRRYTNWLWKKFEGNRQRAIFLDHAKREFTRLGNVLTSESHILLQEAHDYEKYETPNDYDYMTTLSFPVYSRRDEDVDLIGVAAVDIPIKLLNSLIPHHTIGVNGYAFIVTNNGYILMHPGHIREFENIPKPTFNRVDLLEVEVYNDEGSSARAPRVFSDKIVNFRNKILDRKYGDESLNVKYALDNMKRIVQTQRRYVFTGLGGAEGAFTVVIALPEKYGLMVVNVTNVYDYGNALKKTKNWAVHPDWIYCNESGNTAEDIVKKCLDENNTGEPLMKALLFDADVTKWFENRIQDEERFVAKFLVDNVFISTHSGLTRWKTFNQINHNLDEDDDEGKAEKELFRGNRSIDEDWYRRVVEQNFASKSDMFIYSVPFEISGYEWDIKITSTNAIFVRADGNKKSPVAAIGVQFSHNRTFQIYESITKQCRHSECSCDSGLVSCFILDNNAYVIFGQREYTGRFIGDISPNIAQLLVRHNVYKRVEMYDYQAICQKPPEGKSNSGSKVVLFLRRLVENLLHVTNWAFATILFLISSVSGGRDYQSNKNDTLFYEKLQINKTVPTPCDKKMWLYTLGDNFAMEAFVQKPSKPGCDWYYVLERIDHSNLLFMAINPICELVDTVSNYNMTPTPIEVDYNQSLACYIVGLNTFNRTFYNKACYNSSDEESALKNNSNYCGHTWLP